MKAEMTVTATTCSGAGLYAGQGGQLPNDTTVAPTNDVLVRLPLQTKGNTQGEVFSIYYQYSDDLKKQGA